MILQKPNPPPNDNEYLPPPPSKEMSSEALPISNSRFAAALQDLSLASLHLKTLEIRNALAHLAYSNAQLRPFAEGRAPTLDTAAAASAANNTETTTEDGDNSSGSTRQQQQYEPDPDCVEAIRENEAVMRRMRERIDLVRAEVEGRGVSWREFEAPAPAEDTEGTGVVAIGNLSLTNGEVVNGDAAPRGATTGGETTPSSSRDNNTTAGSGNPWTDGTFQTGVIRNGEVHMDAVPGGNDNNNRSGGGTAVDATTTSATSNTTTTTGGRLTDDDLRRLLEQRLAEDEDDVEEEGGLHL